MSWNFSFATPIAGWSRTPIRPYSSSSLSMSTGMSIPASATIAFTSVGSQDEETTATQCTGFVANSFSHLAIALSVSSEWSCCGRKKMKTFASALFEKSAWRPPYLRFLVAVESVLFTYVFVSWQVFAHDPPVGVFVKLILRSQPRGPYGTPSRTWWSCFDAWTSWQARQVRPRSALLTWTKWRLREPSRKFVSVVVSGSLTTLSLWQP